MRNKMQMPFFIGRKQIILEQNIEGVIVSLKRQHGRGQFVSWEQIIHLVYPSAIRVQQPIVDDEMEDA